LTERQQAAVDLRKMEFSVRQIADVLRTKPRAVKFLLQRARERGADADPIRRPPRERQVRVIPFSQLNGRDLIRIENL
jgi:hypothetical protein